MAFGLVLMVMAAFVVGLTMFTVRPGPRAVAAPAAAARSHTVAASVSEPADQPVGRAAASAGKPGGAGDVATGSGAGRAGTASAALDARLAAALHNILGSAASQMSVGVVDLTTGAAALYHPARHYHSASLVKADILATLLYQHQLTRTPISNSEAALVDQMIENNSNSAATRLWTAIGGGAGVRAANRVLKLRHTTPGSADRWGLTSTTAADQLQLLADLTPARSPLDSAGRDYELGLMANVAAGQRWGVPAAASPGTAVAVQNGWLPDPRLWSVNSIGIVRHGGQELLIAVLSSGNATRAVGISAVEAAAIAAADLITKAA